MKSQRRRVLVADDNRDQAVTMVSLVETLGHEVRVANDGLHALEIAIVFRPEVIFLDLGMPGMTGFEFAKQLSGEPWRKKTTIVVCSGYATEEYRQLSRDAGCDFHFAKPMKVDEIRKVFDELDARLSS